GGISSPVSTATPRRKGIPEHLGGGSSRIFRLCRSAVDDRPHPATQAERCPSRSPSGSGSAPAAPFTPPDRLVRPFLASYPDSRPDHSRRSRFQQLCKPRLLHRPETSGPSP